MPSTLDTFFLAALLSLLAGGGVRCECPSSQVGIIGGNYTLTKGLTINSVLIYHCPEGFYPHPEMTRTCSWDNTWKPAFKRSKPQTCRMVECPDPTSLIGGTVEPQQERYFVGNITINQCYPGYPLRGSRKRTCLASGKWSGTTAICSENLPHRCADPGIPPGATRSGNSVETNSKVKYTCNGDLILMGSSERVCLENGQWTGSEPACYPKYAYDTPLEVSLAFGKSIMNTLTVLEPDDKQAGRTIRISKDGVLNIYIGMDISASIGETELERTREAVLSLITKISSFTVSPNYQVIFFSSRVHEAVNILEFFEGKEQLNTLREKIRNFKVNARGHGTDLNSAFKNFLGKMGFIRQAKGEEEFKKHRHVLILFTDGAYNMGGDPTPTVERIKEMVYMKTSQDTDGPSREEHLDIYIFAIGAPIFDATLKPLTVGIGPKHYYKLPYGVSVKGLFDDIIDESEVMEMCGLHRSTESDHRDSKRRMYPWVAFITVQREGKTRECLGSLVTPKFILTAAHCFRFGDRPEHVKVEINDGGDKRKTVAKFFVHENFTLNAKVAEGVPEFYDYDIALIQLEDYVQISVAVRTICIPCTQETSNALKLEGKTTCTQQEARLFQKSHERLAFLTRGPNLVDAKDVHAKLKTERQACIDHALQVEGMNITKAEVAVTDNFLCTGGQQPYIDHIACKGDSGGALYMNFEFRHIQVGIVSWGTTLICEGGGLSRSEENSRDFHINLFRMMPFLRRILGNNEQDDYVPLNFLKD